MQPGIRVRHAPRKCHESRLHRGGGPTVCRGSLRTGVLPVQAAAGLRGGSIGRATGEAAGLMIEDQGLQKPAGADRPRARDTVANVVKASDRKPRCPCHSLILLALAHRGQAPPRGRSAGAGGGPSTAGACLGEPPHASPGKRDTADQRLNRLSGSLTPRRPQPVMNMLWGISETIKPSHYNADPPRWKVTADDDRLIPGYRTSTPF